ncbi:hypothetical protein [Ensifer adhaerens]|uniref:hypothetical protein n=1 Tax=Ensifer adhaerens TaxID=106592 RepID=UPI001319E9E0|nr:hypothetical protein [Ensifer adhaerens]
MQLLNNTTALFLKNYMETTNGLRLPEVVHSTTPILWLVDKDGLIRFAMEEVVSNDTGALNYILPRNGPALRDNEVRLGHPALLDPVKPGDTKAARIGGEIIYDPSPNSNIPWVLTNASGRFGKRPHITRAHLENVKEVFAQFGIPLRAFFVHTPARRGES